ncbi:MAG: hypothetical protein HC898_09250 [Phycisphaerales bacterium]|nr:hypothetical protein [Phycisphaerales bacterium]
MQVVLALQPRKLGKPQPGSWVWREGRKLRLGAVAIKQLLQSVRTQGLGRDYDVNSNGIHRLAMPIYQPGPQLWAVLALAQYLKPNQPAHNQALATALCNAAHRIHRELGITPMNLTG